MFQDFCHQPRCSGGRALHPVATRFIANSSAIAILKWNVAYFAMHKPTFIARLARREFVHLLTQGLSNKLRQQN
jgi:hypothetical protein